MPYVKPMRVIEPAKPNNGGCEARTTTKHQDNAGKGRGESRRTDHECENGHPCRTHIPQTDGEVIGPSSDSGRGDDDDQAEEKEVKEGDDPFSWESVHRDPKANLGDDDLPD